MRHKLRTPKWLAFQESLARALGLGIILNFPGEPVSTVVNSPHLAAWVAASQTLRNAYECFLEELLIADGGAAAKQVSYDPLGLPAVLVWREPDSVVVFGGLPEQAGIAGFDNLNKRLSVYGLSISENEFNNLPSISSSSLLDKGKSSFLVYEHLRHTLHESTNLGSRSLTLSAVEQINRLLLESLSPEEFDLQGILDFAVNSLLILLDVDGAWAFNYRPPGRVIVATRGPYTDQLEAVRLGFERTVSDGQCLHPILDDLANCVSETGHSWDYVCVPYSSGRVRLYLGVMARTGTLAREQANSVISALLAPLAISGELSSLYSALRRQVGTVLNSIRHPIVALGPEGRVGVINKAAPPVLDTLGVTLRVGDKLFGAGLSVEIEAAIRGALAGTASAQESGRFAGGTALTWSVSPLFDEEQGHAGAILMLEDVTETHILREKTADWERMNIAGQMAASLAHEIRSPLAAAMGAIQLVQMSSGKGHERVFQLLARLQSELGRMNKTLNSYLTLARPVRPSRGVAVDPLVPLRQIEFLLRGAARLHDIDLIISVPSEQLPYVVLDPDGLKQVFLNIAKNAFEAMVDGGELTVGLRRAGQSILVEFADTGPGIPYMLRDQVFRPFFTTKIDGTGLGLSVSSAIVKGMGGSLRIGRTGELGTTITIELPVASEADAAGEAEAVAAVAATSEDEVAVGSAGRGDATTPAGGQHQ